MATSRIKTRTYGELLEQLNEMSPSQLNQDITFKDLKKEYHGLEVVLNDEEGTGAVSLEIAAEIIDPSSIKTRK